jgi:cytochrome c553
MMRLTTFLIMLSALTLSVSPLPAATQIDVRGVNLRQQGLRVLDEKCLTCHNRQRIDAALKERKNMEIITRRMEKKGVTLSERDRQVLGHFWQKNPLKKKN